MNTALKACDSVMTWVPAVISGHVQLFAPSPMQVAGSGSLNNTFPLAYTIMALDNERRKT